MRLEIQQSDATLGPPDLRFLTVRSPALGGRGDITVFTPPDRDDASELLLVILLHGVYDSHWAWVFKGAADRIALDLMRRGEIEPMVLAMPSDGLVGDGSGYVRRGSVDCETWIVEDVIQAVRQTIKAASKSSRVYLAGLSMGGFGALRLGAKYAEKFSGISAHSAGTHLKGMRDHVREPLDFADSDEYDVFYWLERNRAKLPPLRFDCGRNDAMFDENRVLHEKLSAAAIDHSFDEFPGGHDWNYWRTHLPDTLKFFSPDKAK